MKSRIALIMVVLLAGCGGETAPAPGGASGAATLAIVNGDFEQSESNGLIPGWLVVQHNGVHAYDTAVESAAAFHGNGGFRMTRTHEQVYGSLVQDVKLPAGSSGTLELSAMMKSSEVGPKGWKLMVISDGVPEYSAPLSGSSEWQRVSVRAKLAPNAQTIRIGATLHDSGSGWLDDVQLQVIR